jgi:hypothetical protein
MVAESLIHLVGGHARIRLAGVTQGATTDVIGSPITVISYLRDL